MFLQYVFFSSKCLQISTWDFILNFLYSYYCLKFLYYWTFQYWDLFLGTHLILMLLLQVNNIWYLLYKVRAPDIFHHKIMYKTASTIAFEKFKPEFFYLIAKDFCTVSAWLNAFSYSCFLRLYQLITWRSLITHHKI